MSVDLTRRKEKRKKGKKKKERKKKKEQVRDFSLQSSVFLPSSHTETKQAMQKRKWEEDQGERMDRKNWCAEVPVGLIRRHRIHIRKLPLDHGLVRGDVHVFCLVKEDVSTLE